MSSENAGYNGGPSKGVYKPSMSYRESFENMGAGHGIYVFFKEELGKDFTPKDVKAYIQARALESVE
jgi:hypothetical protein